VISKNVLSLYQQRNKNMKELIDIVSVFSPKTATQIRKTQKAVTAIDKILSQSSNPKSNTQKKK
jgi:hypothetical protein